MNFQIKLSENKPTATFEEGRDSLHQKIVVFKNNERIHYPHNPNDCSDWTQKSAEQFIASELEAEKLRTENYYQSTTEPDEPVVETPPL